MIYVVDHMKERESVIVGNLARIKAAMSRGESVCVVHPVGKIHGRLANIPGVVYEENAGLNRNGKLLPLLVRPTISAATKALVDLWGAPIYEKLGVRPVGWKARRIAYIHWMPSGKSLQPIEFFHLNMLWAYNAADFFDEIHIRVAGDGGVPDHVSDAIRAVLGGGRAVLDVKGTRNAGTWEWATYTAFLEDIRTDSDMYYMHFKGTSHVPGSSRNKHKVFSDYGDFAGITFWSYLMYRAMFTIPPTDERPAVCGVLHTNPKWSPEVGWDVRPYHASGSFQGYRGKALVAMRTTIEEKKKAAKGNEHRMRYFVEGMMTFLFPEERIGRVCTAVIDNVSMYAGLTKAVPGLYDEFRKGPEYLICQK